MKGKCRFGTQYISCLGRLHKKYGSGTMHAFSDLHAAFAPRSCLSGKKPFAVADERPFSAEEPEGCFFAEPMRSRLRGTLVDYTEGRLSSREGLLDIDSLPVLAHRLFPSPVRTYTPINGTIWPRSIEKLQAVSWLLRALFTEYLASMQASVRSLIHFCWDTAILLSVGYAPSMQLWKGVGHNVYGKRLPVNRIVAARTANISVFEL